MGNNSDTVVTEFILLGLSNHPVAQAVFFWIILAIYLINLLGNGLMVVVIITDPHLHSPMYFFLSNLSFLDICYTSSSVPQALVTCTTERTTISYMSCMAQIHISLYFGTTECILLAVMAYDRFVAICSPLHYSLIMSWRVCVQLAVGTWGSGLILTLVPTVAGPKQFCGSNVINHFTCEAQTVAKLICADTHLNDIISFINTVTVLIVPFIFILMTYVRIGLAVRQIHSRQGRSKAFSTCSSHLAVVGIFYGSAMIMYLQPKSKQASDKDKMISVFYGAVTPMLNPLIYSLRNKDVKGALQKLLGRKFSK
ncbi:olfactory receptor 13H1-like [Hemicordylus capensis]|uniref:olfactory receptor 13H1-like n=1 Tax=Hemicordylus capensis TaxID=884348 RepID=UPI002303A8EF|nr:olfactory receptor 13H1-like [Hemicordylus capensis]